MAIVLPLASEGNLIASAVLISQVNGFPIFVTTLHQIGNSTNFQIVIPPHGGDISQVQTYPLLQAPTLTVELTKVDPVFDLAYFKSTVANPPVNYPKINVNFQEIAIGDELVVVGYPYSTLGSMLETAQLTNVSAKGTRLFMGQLEIPELIISHQTLQGSSGSAVIRRSDGSLCGILRGTLAPPSVISIGNIPLATDTNVTYVTHSAIIKKHLLTLS